MQTFSIRILILLSCTWCFLASADYAWIPNYKSLFLRAGGEYYSTSENLSADGFRENILYQRGIFTNIPLKLDEYRFYVEPEYGFARNLSFAMRGEFVVATVGPLNAAEPSFGSAGLGAVRGALKWRMRPRDPILTTEINFSLPTADHTQTGLVTDEYLLNDGSFDLGLILHSGLRIDEFFLAFSPGLLFRSSGFASAITMQGAAGGRWDVLYGFLFFNSILSLETTQLFDSSLTSHDALGSGGSFTRLSGSPRGIDIGIKLGVNVYKKYAFELGFTKTLWGKQYPDYFKVGLNFLMVTSFFQEERRTRVREIPFDQEQLPERTEDFDETENVQTEEVQTEEIQTEEELRYNSESN